MGLLIRRGQLRGDLAQREHDGGVLHGRSVCEVGQDALGRLPDELLQGAAAGTFCGRGRWRSCSLAQRCHRQVLAVRSQRCRFLRLGSQVLDGVQHAMPQEEQQEGVGVVLQQPLHNQQVGQRHGVRGPVGQQQAGQEAGQLRGRKAAAHQLRAFQPTCEQDEGQQQRHAQGLHGWVHGGLVDVQQLGQEGVAHAVQELWVLAEKGEPLLLANTARFAELERRQHGSHGGQHAQEASASVGLGGRDAGDAVAHIHAQHHLPQQAADVLPQDLLSEGVRVVGQHRQYVQDLGHHHGVLCRGGRDPVAQQQQEVAQDAARAHLLQAAGQRWRRHCRRSGRGSGSKGRAFFLFLLLPLLVLLFLVVLLLIFLVLVAVAGAADAGLPLAAEAHLRGGRGEARGQRGR
mmetsp:Transcript_65329/g.117580  ORF Transcript_65329/g.117580 Transcript_65329/m.117580 type:complete len:403 (+) Transcript_65329:3383-4591(+)